MELLTYSEAAELCRCSKKTLERAWQTGEIDAIKPGNHVLFEKKDLLHWLLVTKKLKPIKVRGRGRRKRQVITGRTKS